MNPDTQSYWNEIRANYYSPNSFNSFKKYNNAIFNPRTTKLFTVRN